MKQLNEILVRAETSILDGLKKMDSSALQILWIVDEAGKLLGSVTDGDILRTVLKGGDFK